MKKKIFTRILLTYLCVAAAVLSLIVPLYRSALRSSRHAVVAEQNRLVEQNYQEIVAHLGFLQQFAYNLSRQDAMHRLAMCESGDERFPIYLYHVKELMSQQTLSNPLGCELVFTFSKNDAVITTERVFDSKTAFYGAFFDYPALSLEEWEEGLSARSQGWSAPVHTRSGRIYPAATYNFYREEGAITISLIVDAEAVLRHIATPDILSSGWIELQDVRYGPLLRLGALEETGLSVGACSSLSSLQLSGGVSEKLVEQSIAPVRALLWLYIFIAVCVFLLLSLLFTIEHARPIWRMTQSLGEFFPPMHRAFSPYKPLQDGVDSVVHTYTQVRRERDNIDLSYRRMLIDSALNGAPLHGETGRIIREIPCLQGAFWIAALKNESGLPPGRQETEKLFSAADARCPGSYLHPCRNLTILMLPIPPEAAGEAFPDWLRETAGGCRIGLSARHAGAEELSEAFREASRALSCAVESGQAYAVYLPNTVCALPAVDRMGLWNLLLHESPEEINAWFSNLLQEESLYQDNAAGAMLYYQILLVLRQLHLQFLKDQSFSTPLYRQEAPLEENFRLLQEQALAIRQALQAQKTEERSDALEQALAYIRQHYCSPELSLSTVAWHVGLSERYLSAKMSEQLGCSYISYVNGLRMEQAARLLRETGLPVSEVAIQSGYEYANTFFKAFRRWSGMTPTQYRKEHQKREE
jgi:AraC-like DNA-binding protein